MKTRVMYKKQMGVYYYIVLIVATFFFMRPGQDLSTLMRLLLMAFYFIPTFLNLKLFPFVFVTFCSISRNSFAAILPTTSFYIVIVVLIAYSLYREKSAFIGKAYLLFFYYLSCSLIYIDYTQDFLLWVPMAILVADMIKTKEDLNNIFYSFLTISLFLSVLFVLNQAEFAQQYGSASLGLETGNWINSNEFGAVIAAGGVLAVGYLTKSLNLENNIWTFLLCGITLAFSFFVLVLNASRGAIFAFSSASAIMLLSSKSKFYLKIVLLIAMGGFIIWMIQNQVFELLSYRMQEDTFDTGGDRTRIWQVKLSLFFDDTNPLHLMFGLSRKGCIELGELISTHNDYVTSLVGFGIIGFIIYTLTILLHPIRLSDRTNRLPILAFMAYFFIESSVVEPFFRGNIVVIMFYFFIIKYAQLVKQESR